MEKRTRRTGIVDCAGRVIIPKKIRDELELVDGTKMDIQQKDKCIIMRKAVACCNFCSGTENLVEIDDNYICPSCIKKIKNL